MLNNNDMEIPKEYYESDSLLVQFLRSSSLIKELLYKKVITRREMFNLFKEYCTTSNSYTYGMFNCDYEFFERMDRLLNGHVAEEVVNSNGERCYSFNIESHADVSKAFRKWEESPWGFAVDFKKEFDERDKECKREFGLFNISGEYFKQQEVENYA